MSATPRTSQDAAPLRAKLRAGVPVIGTFVKTPAHAGVEVLGHAGLDFVVFDAEHAPFDLCVIDALVLAARSVHLPCLVRVPHAAAIGPSLDLGAAGVVVPHVASPGAANAARRAAKFKYRERGFSPGTRANDYGAGPDTYREDADAASLLWCQIEDAAAIEKIEAVATVEDVDCLFIGRADLACSLGVRIDHSLIGAAVARVAAAARHAAAGRTSPLSVGIFVNEMAEIPALIELGIRVFACGSDQSLLLTAARRLRVDMDAMIRLG